MLEAREISIPAWFVVFILFPLVSYFLLGKWNESAKRRHRLNFLFEEATEETLPVDNMAVRSVMAVAQVPNTGIHECARCFAPARTRCSQCKAVRYCSGRCQIVHWRHVHKFECLQLGKSCQSSSPMPSLSDTSVGMFTNDESTESYPFGYNMQQTSADNASSEDAVYPSLNTIPSAATLGMMPGGSRSSTIDRRSGEMSTLSNESNDFSRTVDGSAFMSYEEDSGIGFTQPMFSGSLDDAYLKDAADGSLRCTLHNSGIMEGGSLNAFHVENDLGNLSAPNTAISSASAHNVQIEMMNCSSERTSMKRSGKSRAVSYSQGTELHISPKSRVKTSEGSPSSETNINIQGLPRIYDSVPLQESNRTPNLEVTRTRGNIKDNQHRPVDSANRQPRMKMIFSYAEFAKYFQFEVFGVEPRGLVNIGNSCYANCILQCLMCTKPVITYFLSQSHSRAGCVKDWCLMCELEQLILMLRESGGPLSPVNILAYIQSLNSHIGNGSPEDAHEFLRLLVGSMQSICLEGFGGENAVDPRLQDTTFIQHMFGGWLRSKVMCLRCNHESERHEKMMDLTLEIHGRVKSLEDALTQFTSLEDLDGDNMYRCPRCTMYVRARKQLNVQVAPNILTIVLKRFQEGNYGKIDKYISFPEMLDMVPFMTGTNDIPPLYLLYGVVVHFDTPNASFPGHYISYVKDLQGNWSRVDDTEVRQVDLSQVMSEEAYILFYMRSHPRPTRGSARATRHRTSNLPRARQSPSRIQRPSRLDSEQCRENHSIRAHELSSQHKLEATVSLPNISTGILIRESQMQPPILRNCTEFPEVTTSSDWSPFTFSDDSSFSTESTRDSFSADPALFTSIFPSLHPKD